MPTTVIDRIDGLNGDVAMKAPCRVATTANLAALSGLLTVDGVTLAAGDRILVKDQTTGSQNGVYVVSVGAWARAADFDGNRDIVSGSRIPINLGTVNAGTIFYITTADPLVIGTTALAFAVTPATVIVTLAQNKILGRLTAGTGTAEALSGAQVATLLPAVAGDSGAGGTAGLVPAPGVGDTAAGKFLSASGAFSVPAQPTVPMSVGGRLTLLSGTSVISADATVSSLFYTPIFGNLVPIYNGSVMTLQTFAELTLALVSQHTALALYDVFVFLNGGVVTIGTGPAWSVAGNFVSAGAFTAGTAARGTGGGSTELQRVLGFWTNKNTMTLRNGATTYANISPNQATYLGTIWIDAAAGQVTAHVGYGQNRKFGVWNAYNRIPIIMTAGDPTASWGYNTGTFRKANNNAANAITTLCGLAEEWTDTSYEDRSEIGNIGEAIGQIGVGYNSLTATTGRVGTFGHGSTNTNTDASVMRAVYAAPPALGLNAIIALESGPGATNQTWYGTQANQELRAAWRG